MSQNTPKANPTLALLSYLDLSTSHLSEADKDMLEVLAENGKTGITLAQYEYGFFASVPEKEYVPENLPASLKAILDVARDLGASVVRIDSDGEVIECLPTYEW